MRSDGLAPSTNSPGAIDSPAESGAVSARVRAWLPLRSLFVGDAVSGLPRFLGCAILLPASGEVRI